ncbi:MAG: TonB-dependent receptor [Bacteroidota bacterium]|nr:TonB-dependent receptor [Bacteroidota bacterium]
MKIRLTMLSTILCFLCMFLHSSILAQNNSAEKKTVTGKITDDKGAPIEGASVQIRGKAIGTVTKADGTFSLSADEKSTLVISATGYTSQEVQVKQTTHFAIKLVASTSALDEVVVIGYGTVKKKDVTGAVAGIGQQELKSRPVTDALQAMQGKVAGVDISSNERPGTVGSINIRGVRSLTASNSPLFVVDGIPLMTGGIENINPNDIESIDILKDASATAIYGSRGANGVVIVTTKQGKAGKVTLSVSHATTLENLQDSNPGFSAGDYIDFRRWAYYYSNPSAYPRGDMPNIANDQKIFLATSDPSAWANIAKGWSGGSWDGSKVATTDWKGMVKQQGVTTNNLLSVSGGSDKVKAYGSFGYLSNTGTIKGQSFIRYTAKSSVDITATKWFSMGSNVNVTYSVQEYGQSQTNIGTIGTPASGLYESARSLFPYAVPYDSLGNRILYPGGDVAFKNVADEWNYNRDQRVTLRAFGSFYTQVNFGSIFPFLKGLRYRMNFGPDFSLYRDGIYIDANSVASGGSSYASLSKNQTFSYTLDNLLYYDKTIGKHSFGVTLLQSQTAYNSEGSGLAAKGIPFSSQLWNALTQTNIPTAALSSYNSSLTEMQLLSYMARVNYSYADKYLLTVSARSDGASQLAAGHKYSLFPSAALAWRISKEKFMKANWVNDLKLRLGAGVTGNSAISAYATQGAVTPIFYPYLSSITAGTTPSSVLANQGLGWEKTAQYNLGIDFSLFKRRVSGSIDVYTSNTTDLLMQRNIPTVTGFTTTYANVGQTANNGFDISLNTVNINKKDFQWNTTLNVSWQKEHIVSLSNGKQDDINNNWFIGQPIGVIYGYASAGLWHVGDSTQMKAFNANGHKFSAGNVRPVDQNGDNKIDANNDRVIIGYTRPRWIVGMTNTFEYKGFELSIFLYGRLRYMYNTGGEAEVGRSNQRKINYYTENNQNAEYQKPIYSTGTGDPYFASLGYREASFIKIRNISLGYNFNGKTLAKAGMSNLKAYLQVANPGMLFSKISWIDMDVVSSTWNRGITFGINASF